MKLSLVIPCFNEAKNIPIILEKCKIFDAGTIEIIIVDNGSVDSTETVLKNLLPLYPMCKSVRIQENLGYGGGILYGLSFATGEIIGWTHADLQTDVADVFRALKIFENNNHEVFVKGLRCGRPILDSFFTVWMSFFETIYLKKLLWDINAQPTLFSKKFYAQWLNPPADFSLDLYAYYYAKKNGIPIKRLKVNFHKRIHGQSNWNINWKSRWKFIKRTINFTFKLKKL